MKYKGVETTPEITKTQTMDSPEQETANDQNEVSAWDMLGAELSNESDLEDKEDKESLKMNRQLETIATINQRELPVLLFGGFAEDAWLHSEPSREHADLDYLGFREDIPGILSELEELGFEQEDVEEGNDKPQKYVLRDGPVSVDIVPIEHHQEERGAYIDVRNYDNNTYRIELPDEVLDYPEQQLGDIPVHTTAPAMQVLTRRFFSETERLPLREKDEVGQQKLLEQFPESDVQLQFKTIQG